MNEIELRGYAKKTFGERIKSMRWDKENRILVVKLKDGSFVYIDEEGWIA